MTTAPQRQSAAPLSEGWGMTLLDELKAEAEQRRADGNTRIPALLERAIAALELQGEPVAWVDSELLPGIKEFGCMAWLGTQSDHSGRDIPLYLSAPTIPAALPNSTFDKAIEFAAALGDTEIKTLYRGLESIANSSPIYTASAPEIARGYLGAARALSERTLPAGWIPVSERLPEKNERVTYYFERIGVWHGVYLGGEQWRSLGGFCTGDITHWMPETLPAPPMIGEAK